MRPEAPRRAGGRSCRPQEKQVRASTGGATSARSEGRGGLRVSPPLQTALGHSGGTTCESIWCLSPEGSRRARLGNLRKCLLRIRALRGMRGVQGPGRIVLPPHLNPQSRRVRLAGSPQEHRARPLPAIQRVHLRNMSARLQALPLLGQGRGRRETRRGGVGACRCGTARLRSVRSHTLHPRH